MAPARQQQHGMLTRACRLLPPSDGMADCVALYASPPDGVFYAVVSASCAILPALANPAYFTCKLTSAVITSLMTGVYAERTTLHRALALSSNTRARRKRCLQLLALRLRLPRTHQACRSLRTSAFCRLTACWSRAPCTARRQARARRPRCCASRRCRTRTRWPSARQWPRSHGGSISAASACWSAGWQRRARQQSMAAAPLSDAHGARHTRAPGACSCSC